MVELTDDQWRSLEDAVAEVIASRRDADAGFVAEPLRVQPPARASSSSSSILHLPHPRIPAL